MDINFGEFPILESKRLTYRQVTRDDAAEILSLRGDEVLMKYIPRPLAKNMDDAISHIDDLRESFEKGQHINWAVTYKGQNKIIGTAGLFRFQPENLRAEIGYMFLAEHHGKGLASEAVHTILSYAFNVLRLHSVEAVIDPANLPSEKVLVANGFSKEGHFRENCYWEGRYLDSVIYSILDREYNSRSQTDQATNGLKT